MSHEKNEFTYNEDYTAKCINILIETVLNPENLHEIGADTASELKNKYEQEGHVPDGEQQDIDFCDIVTERIARQIGV